jgi:hypothetical protein
VLTLGDRVGLEVVQADPVAGFDHDERTELDWLVEAQ